MALSNKVAVVTGAGTGIGRAIALSLAKKGIIPVIVDINESTSSKVVKEVEKIGIKTSCLKVDVSKVEEVNKMVNYTVQEYGTIDILVNNAGILHTKPIEDITEEDWDDIMAVNLKSMFFASKAALVHMKKKKWGRIINISSVAGRMGGYGAGVDYAATKAGIIGLTMSMARKIAEYNITINAVAPGTTETDIIKKLSEQKKSMLKELIPLKRLGKPENVADAVAFLASDGSDFITGAVIDVNGGLFMG